MPRLPFGETAASRVALSFEAACSEAEWSIASHEVLWCWKRDRGGLQRSIYFGGCFEAPSSFPTVSLRDWTFFYKHRAARSEIEELHALVDVAPVRHTIGRPRITPLANGLATLELRSRWPNTDADLVIRRLQARRPRQRLPRGAYPTPTVDAFDLDAAAPIVVYAGSGLSYEAGLPTLAEIHRDFGVDDYERGELTFGRADPIPRALGDDPVKTLAGFVRFHLQAAAAEPSWSHRRIARLHDSGVVRCILTDNVDNLFAKCGVSFARTRTVFPGTVSYRFAPGDRTLLVIGVAADRRNIIAQARRAGLHVVVVNPLHVVSPFAQNLSYLRRDDCWYRLTAEEFFQRCKGS